MNLGLNYQRQKSGQRTVVSYFMKFVRIFAGVYCTGGDERRRTRWRRYNGNF